MKNILLIYEGSGASHRIANATMTQYQGYLNSGGKDVIVHFISKSKVNLKSQISKLNINIVYVYHLLEDLIEELKQLNMPYITYARSDFYERRENYNYYLPNEVDIKYTLFEELLNQSKSSYGKMKVFKIENYEIVESEMWVVDYNNYVSKSLNNPYMKIFGSYETALQYFISALKTEKQENVRKIEDMKKYYTKQNEKIDIILNKYTKGC